MFNANSETSAKFRQESDLASQLLSNRIADDNQDREFRQYRRGQYRFLSYGNCEINSLLGWGVGL